MRDEQMLYLFITRLVVKHSYKYESVDIPIQ